ncbi:MAG TPA: GtrA family protein [Spongiibacteraceae bacterium]|nr:GtrA family protein [Spongiibacteraceae bacterium]
MIKHFVSRQFGVFLLTGGFAAIVNFGSRILYSHWLSFSAAIIAAYVSGMLVAFILARIFVFGSTRHSTLKSAFFFTLINFFGALQTWVVSIGLADYLLPRLGLQQNVHEWAHLVGIAVPVFTSYLGHKYWSFGQ